MAAAAARALAALALLAALATARAMDSPFEQFLPALRRDTLAVIGVAAFRGILPEMPFPTELWRGPLPVRTIERSYGDVWVRLRDLVPADDWLDAVAAGARARRARPSATPPTTRSSASSWLSTTSSLSPASRTCTTCACILA